MTRPTSLFPFAGVLAVGLSLVALGSVPRSFAADLTQDVGFGNFRDQQIVSTSTLVLDEVLEHHVSEIGQRLARAAGRPDARYYFRIVNDPVVQARATAGGFIYVHTGLLDTVQGPDELAGVLAHEMAHINQSHLVTEIHSKYRTGVVSKFGLAGGLALAGAAGGGYSGTVEAARLAFLGAQLGEQIGTIVAETASTGFRRQDEVEADDLALEYVLAAGYNARGFATLLRRMRDRRQDVAVPAEIHSSLLVNKRPGLAERIERYEGRLAQRGAPAARSGGSTPSSPE